jgi:hypothetical protein
MGPAARSPVADAALHSTQGRLLSLRGWLLRLDSNRGLLNLYEPGATSWLG